MTDIMRIMVVDDEPLAIERMLVLLARCEGIEVVGIAETGQAALRLSEALTPDACLLDIGMPEMDGIAVARALHLLPKPPNIVFVTAFDRFAVVAFDIQAIDYLVKPVGPGRLDQALQRLRHHIQTSEPDARPSPYLSEFWVPEQRGFTRVSAQAVDRITAERDYMRLHVGKRSWLINESLAHLETQLNPEKFVRLHRGAIVRRDFIAGLRHDDAGWMAKLEDGTEQKVGRHYVKNARKLAGRD